MPVTISVLQSPNQFKCLNFFLSFKMSLTLPQIPPEVREKIFKEIDHEKIISCLEIDQWKDVILDYLYQKVKLRFNHIKPLVISSQ